MKKMLTACVFALTAVVGFAQTTTDRQGVTTSTDPAKAAAVERQGAELKTQYQKVAGSGTAAGNHRVKAHNGRRHRHHKVAAAK
jgi:hypothetical protein